MEQKILISTGCTNFLVNEVEALRRKNELLSAQMSIVDNFFGMINRIGAPRSQGYSEDQLYQAKKEIRDAMAAVESKG